MLCFSNFIFKLYLYLRDSIYNMYYLQHIIHNDSKLFLAINLIHNSRLIAVKLFIRCTLQIIFTFYRTFPFFKTDQFISISFQTKSLDLKHLDDSFFQVS